MNRHALQAAARQVLFATAVLWVSMGARTRSANFIVETADPNFAQQVARTAEQFRHDLAVDWLGQALPNWAQPCVVNIQAGPQLGAGGATKFKFDRGEVYDWVMSIQGSRERLLDSVLPHEITHTIFASHFRQPLPRWADEGGATSVEHASEKNKHWQALNVFLRTNRGIPFNQMFAMTEYPQDIMPLYAQGYSLAEYLIETGGRRKFVEFLGDGLKSDDWPAAVQRHYGIHDLSALQNTWLAWVRQGSPNITPRNVPPAAAGELLAANARRPRPAPNLIYHIPDRQPAAAAAIHLVPVTVPTPTAATSSIASTNPARNASPTSLPRLSNEQVALLDAREAKLLPASGWHPAGEPAAPPSVDPFSTQVSRPLPLEQPRQQVIR
jgi:hypothetical protein